jgi:hypothetical protein
MSTDPWNVKGFGLLQSALARAAADDDYRQKLLADPAATLAEEGLQVPEGVDLVVHENADDRLHLVIPSRVVEWDRVDVEEVDAAIML